MTSWGVLKPTSNRISISPPLNLVLLEITHKSLSTLLYSNVYIWLVEINSAKREI